MTQTLHGVPPTRHSLNTSLNIDPDGAAALLREAIDVAVDPSARLELTMLVRQSRPASMELLLLHCLVRYIHDRVAHAERIDAATGLSHSWEQLFPELPAISVRELAGVAS